MFVFVDRPSCEVVKVIFADVCLLIIVGLRDFRQTVPVVVTVVLTATLQECLVLC